MAQTIQSRGVDFTLDRLEWLWELDHERVLWRHDVDHFLNYAVMMAELEYTHGIRSVYYLRAYASGYDILGGVFRRTVERILACGHQVGAHVDLRLPRDAKVSDDQLVTACTEQAATLADWPVEDRVSLHRPPEDTVWRDIPGYDHALAACWRGLYSSDSRQRFRRRPEYLLLSKARAQINLHPCWWFLPPAEAEKLRRRHEERA